MTVTQIKRFSYEIVKKMQKRRQYENIYNLFNYAIFDFGKIKDEFLIFERRLYGPDNRIVR